MDGEFRLTGFMTGFPESVEGFVQDAYAPVAWKGGSGNEGASPNTQLVVGKRLRSKKRIAKNEADFLKKHASGPFKITLPSPVNFAVIFWRRGVSESAYPTPSDFLTDAASILASEAQALANEGAPYIQLDASGVYTLGGCFPDRKVSAGGFRHGSFSIRRHRRGEHDSRCGRGGGHRRASMSWQFAGTMACRGRLRQDRIRSNAGLPSLRESNCDAAFTPESTNRKPTSAPSSRATTNTPSPTNGPSLPTKFSPPSNASAKGLKTPYTANFRFT